MRRRKTKYTWFPVIGGDEATQGEGNLPLSTVTRSVAAARDGSVTTDIFPLIPDEPAEVAQGGDHLVDYIGTSWFIKRLVGKIHIFYEQDPRAASGSGGSTVLIPPAVVVVAGFFVARVDASETSVPIGDNANLDQDYSPLALATQREPWIWRRSWILGNNVADTTTLGFPPAGFAWPATNASRSIVDGPHIDAKTARRSQNDERLWFAISAWAWPQGEPIDESGVVSYTLDLRVLGAVRKQRNRSAF